MFKEKIKKRSQEIKNFQIVFSIFIFLFTIFLAYSNLKIFQKNESLKAEGQILREKIHSLKKERARLEEEISQTKTESYWERKIREEGYLKEGENLAIILPPNSFEEKGPIKEEKSTKNFLEKLRDFFQGVKEWFK